MGPPLSGEEQVTQEEDTPPFTLQQAMVGIHSDFEPSDFLSFMSENYLGFDINLTQHREVSLF